MIAIVSCLIALAVTAPTPRPPQLPKTCLPGNMFFDTKASSLWKCMGPSRWEPACNYQELLAAARELMPVLDAPAPIVPAFSTPLKERSAIVLDWVNAIEAQDAAIERLRAALAWCSEEKP